jgi:hypothetical protein
VLYILVMRQLDRRAAADSTRRPAHSIVIERFSLNIRHAYTPDIKPAWARHAE